MTKEPVLPRVVIDTDTDNELDDHCAVAGALRAGDRIIAGTEKIARGQLSKRNLIFEDFFARVGDRKE